jgi:hypothetical protein
MNDVEQELRELFDERARDARTAPMPPAALLRRGRRRQIGTAAIGAVTALLVVVASVAVLRTVGSGATTTPVASNDLGERTATIQNFTLTAPAGWTMIDWWPISDYLAVTATGSGSTTVPAPSASVAGSNAAVPTTAPTATSSDASNPSLADVVPVLEVSTFDPGLDATLWCGSGGQIGAGDALLYVAVDAAAMRSGDPLPPPWPVPLQGSDTASGGPCGPGSYSRFSLGGVPYFAFARFGSDVTGDVHQQLLDVFDGMQAQDAPLPHPAGMTPGYVVASGNLDGDAWRLELGSFPPAPFTNDGTPSVGATSLVWASIISGSEDLRGTVPLGASPMPPTPATTARLGGAVMVPIGSQGLVVGSVLPDAASVQYVVPDGTRTDADLVRLPDDLRRATAAQGPGPDRMFWSLTDGPGGEIVQLAADGAELLRERIVVLGSATGGSNSASPNQLPYEISNGLVTARGTFQGTPWKVEQLYDKDGVRLTIGGAPENLGVPQIDERIVRAIDASGYGAIVLVLTGLDVDRVAVTSEGSWDGRWMPSSTGDGAEARLWVIELPGAGSGTLELNGEAAGTVRWP